MIRVTLNRDLYVYDIQGLVMAFYPGEKIFTEFPGTEKKTEEQASRTLLVQYEVGEPLSVSFELRVRGKKLPLATEEEKASGPEEPECVFRKDRILLVPEGARSEKTVLKRALYALLREESGRTLPWGTLTGIRPTKIAMGMLKEERSIPEILAHLEGNLLCSEEKSTLAVRIAERELKLLQGVDTDDGFSLYVGIPFCPSICLYCSFSSFPLARYQNRVGDYLTALIRELDFAAETFRDKKLNTIYFGGGTPTTLSPGDLDRLFSAIEARFDLSRLLEWTVEAGRPDSVSEDKLRVMKDHPVSRISVNPQTMHQKTLDLIGRRHTVKDVLTAYELARKCGFDNINMDLIAGLPGESREDMEETFRRVAGLRPENVTIHSLALKRAARLNLERAEYAAFRMENSDDIMRCAEEILQGIGLQPYYLYRQKNMAGNQENVGYALPGKEGLYNILIMEEIHTILALGAGATTKRVERDRITRAENVKDVDTYIRNIDEMIARKKRLFDL